MPTLRILSRPLVARLVAGTLWNLWANVVYRGVALTLSVYLAHTLTSAQFADFNTLQNALTTLFTIASMGLGLAATRYTAELAESNRARCGEVLSGILLGSVAFSAILALMLCIFSARIADMLLKDNAKYGQILLLSGLLIVTVLVSVQAGMLAGLQAFKTFALVQTGTGAVSLGIQLLAARASTFSIFLVAWLLGSMLVAIANQVTLSRLLNARGISLHLTGAWRALRSIASFFLPASAVTLVVFPAHTAALMLLNSVGRDPIQVSWFQTGLLWTQLIAFVPTALAGTLLPMLTELMRRDGGPAMIAWARRGALPVLAVVTTLCAAFALAAPWIALLYGPKFENAANLFRIAALIGFFFSINGLLGNLITTLSAMRAAVACSTTWTLAYVGLAALAGRFHGAYGMLACCLAAYVVHFAALTLVTRKLAQRSIA
ncbi:hypothetical protein PI87_10290 [Ralstonia sp. A12]|uniref:oligosaccharide flippase family protein n=1 Tax=Ralstonia sp. A12 TaxID=1217052 RepID=UPI0005750045|nr:oligosaccharide flippase family protein [Ralstonia sp. A12]KHK56115.1 hypothetical protein PI87_10290 [Ralstonia sp. A12]